MSFRISISAGPWNWEGKQTKFLTLAGPPRGGAITPSPVGLSLLIVIEWLDSELIHFSGDSRGFWLKKKRER